MLSLSQNRRKVVGVLILVAFLIYFVIDNPNKRNRRKEANSKLSTEQILLQQNAELLKKLLDEKDKQIESKEDRIRILEDQLAIKKSEVAAIKKQTNEKISRVSNYTDDDILRYLSELDSTYITDQDADTKQ